MRGYSKSDILQIVKERDIKFIRLQFTDIFGTLKNVALTSGQLEKAMSNQCMFDGSSIEGFVRVEESDMYLYPDISTFAELPWSDPEARTARLICDVYKPDGTPFEGDPRHILKKVLKQAYDMGYTFNVGPELEFFLFNTDENGHPTTKTHDRAGYFDLGPTDRGEECRRDICLTLEKIGFEIEASHHEVAPAQHEIDFKYGEALSAADNIITFKLAVKTIAQMHGLCATFMPKPVYGVCGSGMHVNMSLSENGRNAFYDSGDANGLSVIAYNFIAGLIEHVPAITAFTNPLVNSYKRLVPGYEAPVYIAWSQSNRTPLIRIPVSKGEATRIELRSPDPSSNPYLVLSVCLVAGLDGIKRKLKPADGVDTNLFDLNEVEREALGIKILPANLKRAILALKKNDLIKDTVGDHICGKYITAKMEEWEKYSTRVSQWEIDEYLGRY